MPPHPEISASWTKPPTIHEQRALSERNPAPTVDVFHLQQQQQQEGRQEQDPERRERRRRQKRWSDGVIEMNRHRTLNEEDQVELNRLETEWKNEFRPLRRLSKQQGVMELAVPTPGTVHAHIRDVHGKESWRFQVAQFLHKRKVRNFFLALLVLDVVLLFLEVTLLAMFPFCVTILRDAMSCSLVDLTNYTDDDVDRDYYIYKSSYCSDQGDVADDPNKFWVPKADYPVGCDPHKWHAVHVAEDVLFVLTIIILSCFLIELTVMMIVLTPRVFFRQVFYLADYIVIVVSIVLELFLKLAHDNILSSSVAGMLVIFRSWRYVRIGHGIVEVTHELAEQKFTKLLNYTEHLEKILQEQGLVLPEEHEKVEKIRAGEECDLMAEVRRQHAEHERHKLTVKTIHSDSAVDDCVEKDKDYVSPEASMAHSAP